MRLIPDASVVVKWFVTEPDAERARALITPDTAVELQAPDFLMIECANVIWNKVRRGEMLADTAEPSLRALQSAAIGWLPSQPLVLPALAIARTIAHPVYDCLYLAAAEAENASVITADRRFFGKAAASPFADRVRLLADFAA